MFISQWLIEQLCVWGTVLNPRDKIDKYTRCSGSLVSEYLLPTSFLFERDFKQVKGIDITSLYFNQQKCPLQLCEPDKEIGSKIYYNYGYHTLQLIENDNQKVLCNRFHNRISLLEACWALSRSKTWKSYESHMHVDFKPTTGPRSKIISRSCNKERKTAGVNLTDECWGSLYV